jgi:ATP-binding cassette subfamily B protein
MTFYQNIAVGNIKELDNEALLKEQRKLADKLALKFPEGYQQMGRRFNDGVELLAENGSF